MSKFALDKNFESINGSVPKTAKRFELVNFDKETWTLYLHDNDSVEEIATLTKEELRTLWIMLTTN